MIIPAGLKTFLEIADTTLDATQFIPLVLRFFRGTGSSEKEKLSADRIEQLMRDGKIEEAKDAAMGVWEQTFSMKDEMRLGRDIAILVDSEILEDRKGLRLLRIVKTLSPSMKAKFRDAYTSERERKFRLMFLTYLANLKTQTEVLDSLEGMGVFDPTALERMLNALIVPLDFVAKQAASRTRVLKKERTTRCKAKAALPPKVETWWDKHPTIAAIIGFRLI